MKYLQQKQLNNSTFVNSIKYSKFKDNKLEILNFSTL